ncbi:hypothetical protein IP90_02463 [Luteimonas cucumeris]|uniref:Uncharacterized protein n=1 Tax=Luteimonas cucumeris TaxID=985012 RepID=A0A562L2P7_9GAMM|nr:hypothetical protein IP90_02463 [Luteimonas cucumeris]
MSAGGVVVSDLTIPGTESRRSHVTANAVSFSLGHPAYSLDPEGGAQDVRRFPTEPWVRRCCLRAIGSRTGERPRRWHGPVFCRRQKASRKIPAPLHACTGALSGKALSLVTFFGPAKKVTRRKAEAFAATKPRQLHLPYQLESKSFRPLKRSGHFSLMAQRKVTKRKGPPRHVNPAIGQSVGIFRLAILARSENAAHPCAAPFGSGNRLSAQTNSERRIHSALPFTEMTTQTNAPHGAMPYA